MIAVERRTGESYTHVGEGVYDTLEFTAEDGKKILSVSGTAANREALRTYQLALQGAPFTLTAALPVSAYAKDSDIAFTITITLSP